jgi:hypothetical protein
MRTTRSSAPAPTSPRRRRPSREGLRQVRIWIPDMDAKTFREEAHRQSLAVASSPGERDNQDFVDSISELLLLSQNFSWMDRLKLRHTFKTRTHHW